MEDELVWGGRGSLLEMSPCEVRVIQALQQMAQVDTELNSFHFIFIVSIDQLQLVLKFKENIIFVFLIL